MQRSVLPSVRLMLLRPSPCVSAVRALRGNSSARDPAGSLRGSASLLQEYSQKREAAEIPRKNTARGGRRGAQAIYSSATLERHAIAAANQAIQIREITPSILADERHDAVQRRDRELVVTQNVVIRMLRPHADARREV